MALLGMATSVRHNDRAPHLSRLLVAPARARRPHVVDPGRSGRSSVFPASSSRECFSRLARDMPAWWAVGGRDKHWHAV